LEVLLEGYAFEEWNRGYLNNVYIRVQHPKTGKTLGEAHSNVDGYFKMMIEQTPTVNVFAKKTNFKMKQLDLNVEETKMFIKVEMIREPGYTFEVTLAEKRKTFDATTNAITGALIEVYNNTTRKSELVLKDSEDPEFDISFKKGNHYTILIRKPGYLSKRMEAFVDVEGCILCFEGVGQVQPGVSDNLTDENAAGVLLANVELEPIFTGKTLEIENIYYGLGKWNITKKAKEQLEKVILLMEDNPNLTLELGSHTDSRGRAAFNKNLSEKRARASVDYVVINSNVERSRVISKGYGEENILNDCVDGVKCDEMQHGENRRTELKIVGIGDIGRYKPLAQMKEEEFIEKEILGQGEVRVAEGETLEQVLERNANKPVVQEEEINTAKQTNPIAEEKEIIKKVAEKVLEEVTETELIKKVETIENTELPAELPDSDKEKIKVSEKMEEDVEIVTSAELPRVTEKVEAVEQEEVTLELPNSDKEEIKEQLEKDIEITTPVEMPKADEKAEVESVEIAKSEEPILEEVKVELKEDETSEEDLVEEAKPINEVMDRLNDMPTEEESETSEGYKIVIHKSPAMLSAEDELIKRHDKLELYVADDSSIWYMMAGFRSKQQAQEALRFVKTTYSDAYIVNIVDGKLK